MNFTILHIAAVFFLGFFLGSIFGLGIHYLRPAPKPKRRSDPSRPPLQAEPERELLPDTPETIINRRSRSPELDYPSLAPLTLEPAYSQTTRPEATPTPSEEFDDDFDKTQDFQMRLDSDSFSGSIDPEFENDIDGPPPLDIAQENPIDEDVTQVMPRKE